MQISLRIFCLILIKLMLAYFYDAEKIRLIIVYNLGVIIDYFRMMVFYRTILCLIFCYISYVLAHNDNGFHSKKTIY